MTTLHMETGQVRELISRMDRATSEFLDQTESLRSIGPTLSNAWEGASATEFIADTDELARNYLAQAQALDTLARRLSHELDEWEQADADFSGSDLINVEINQNRFTWTGEQKNDITFIVEGKQVMEIGVQSGYQGNLRLWNVPILNQTIRVNRGDLPGFRPPVADRVPRRVLRAQQW